MIKSVRSASGCFDVVVPTEIDLPSYPIPKDSRNPIERKKILKQERTFKVSATICCMTLDQGTLDGVDAQVPYTTVASPTSR